MDTIFLDAAAMPDRETAHRYLAGQLAFPDYYGKNLDALFDLLSERSAPTRLVIRDRRALENTLGPYGAALLRTLEDAAAENPALFVEYGENPSECNGKNPEKI